MRKFLAFLFLGFALLLFAKLSFAQVGSSSATTAHLSFPIPELGNCNSAADCKTYCDDPVDLPACVAYAKEKGFYKQSELDTNQEAVLEDAKTTLGCDSLSSCQTFCQDSAHASECSAFAQKHNLSGGQQQVGNQTLTKAEAVLGCTSADTCRAFCEQSQNQQTCSAFAKENGIKGGDQTVGPGGCTSESSCKLFCASPNNFQACQQFVQSHTASGSGQTTFTGPGGCNSQQACQSFCDKNPTACHTNPAGHDVPMSATVAAHLQNTSVCREHPQLCNPTIVPTNGSNGQPDTNAGSSGSIAPHKQAVNTENNQNSLPPTRDKGSQEEISPTGNIFPTTAQSVKAASTHQDFWSWLVGEIFRVK